MSERKKQLAIAAMLIGGMVFAGVASITPFVIKLAQQGNSVVAMLLLDGFAGLRRRKAWRVI